MKTRAPLSVYAAAIASIHNQESSPSKPRGKKKLSLSRLLTMLFFLWGITIVNVSAQYNTLHNNVWAFGYNGGINFSPGPAPTAFTSSVYSYEGTASMCDALGNLQLYTEGMNVYDATGTVMPNGTSVVPYGTFSCTQGAVIVPLIGNTNQYYVFSLEHFDSDTGRLSYCVVDMTLNGGLGDVITTPTRTHLLTNGLSEGMTVVKGNNCNIWLIVHSRTTPAFIAYNITSQGVEAPVISTAGAFSGPYAYKRGSIKVSPDRLKIAHCSTDGGGGTPGLEYLDFDPTTGVVSNCRLINTYGNHYDAEFSPSSNRLYTRPISGQIYQYDVSVLPSTAANIAATEYAVTSYTYPDRGGEMKLGLDGKIYCQTNAGYLDCIHQPDLTGAACAYANHDVALGSGHTGIGITNMALAPILQFPAPITGNPVICQGMTSVLHNASPGFWSSSNPASATIDAGGTMTGLGAGTGYITYTVPSIGCYVTIADTIQALPSITPTPVCAGGVTQFSATPAGGTWSSSDTTIAKLLTTDGVILGVSPGTVTISYTLSGGCFASVPVTVTPGIGPISGTLTICQGTTSLLTHPVPGGVWYSSHPAIASISPGGLMSGVAPGMALIIYQPLGSTCNAAAIVTINPAAVVTPRPVCIGSTILFPHSPLGGSWSVSNPSIATVDASGNVTGVSSGTTTITYTTLAGCSTVVTATVNTATPPIMGSLTGCVGDTWQLTDSALGGYWGSSDGSVAYINANTGWVTAVSPGTTTITFYAPNGCTASAVVTIDPTPVISGTSTLCIGDITTLTSSVPGGTWSSSNPAVATVDASGVVTGLSAGSATISYTSPAGCIGTFKIIVSKKPVANIVNARGTGNTICVGGAIVLKGTTGSSGGVVSWSCSNPLVATITSISTSPTESYCTISALSVGTATFTYTITSGSCTAVATFTITVLGYPVITAPSPASVCMGASPLSLSATPPGGTWASSTPAIATVSPTGDVYPLSPVVVTIMYTDGCTAQVSVTINPAPVPKIINADKYHCLGYPVYIAADPGTPGVVSYSWTSSNPSVATVSGSTTGATVTGLSVGTTIITFSVTNSYGCTGYTTHTVIVNTAPGPITGSAMLCMGVPTPFYNSVSGGVWSSSNPAVATVDPVTGVVTGVAGGSATIYYSTGPGCTVTMDVKVIYACLDIVTNNIINVVGTAGITADIEAYDAAGVLISTATGVALGTNVVTLLGSPSKICIVSFTYGSIVCPANCCVHKIGGSGPYDYGFKPANPNGTTVSEDENTITISPNPNFGELAIHGQVTTSSEYVNIEVTDMTGKVIMRETCNVVNNRIDKKISLASGVANGMYLLKVGGENVNTVKRFMLNR